MITSIKEILSGSKGIRRYLLLWAAFFAGILIMLPFLKTTSALRYISLAGFLLSAGSIIGALVWMQTLAAEIRNLHPNTIGKAKRFLVGLFYFSRLPILFIGLFVLVQVFNQKEISPQDLVEIEGKIARIEIIGEKSPTLKIHLESNSNQYGLESFQTLDNDLQQIETGIKQGEVIFLLIERADENAVNDQYVQVYAVRTENDDYLTLDDYQITNSSGNWAGVILGIFFSVSGLIFLLTGKIYKYKH